VTWDAKSGEQKANDSQTWLKGERSRHEMTPFLWKMGVGLRRPVERKIQDDDEGGRGLRATQAPYPMGRS